MAATDRSTSRAFPHRIAVLCDLRDDAGRVLLIHRHKEPNRDLYSPIGGKLDLGSGESPLMAARREIHEEAGIDVHPDQLHLGGLISEHGFEGRENWLMFWYRVMGPVQVEPRVIREGSLEWHDSEALPSHVDRSTTPLAMPETDRRVIWPLVLAHDGGFFSVHIDCTGKELRWTVEESRPAVAGAK